MYVYIRSEAQLWTVGFYSPDGKWNSESDHDTREEAAKRVRYLSGDVKERGWNFEDYIIGLAKRIEILEKQNDGMREHIHSALELSTLTSTPIFKTQ